MVENLQNNARNYDLRVMEVQGRADQMFAEAEAEANAEQTRIKQKVNREHNAKKTGLGPNTKR